MRRAVLLALLWCAGGCTSILSGYGDPDLSVLRYGAERALVEAEVGEPREVREERGRVVATYRIRIGAPKNEDGRLDSLKHVGIGTAAGIGTGIVASKAAGVALLNSGAGDAVGTTIGLTVGLVTFGVVEGVGTIRELRRLSRAKPHELEVSYGMDNRLRSHRLKPLGDARE